MTSTLTLQVWDWDLGSRDDKLGSATVDLSPLLLASASARKGGGGEAASTRNSQGGNGSGDDGGGAGGGGVTQHECTVKLTDGGQGEVDLHLSFALAGVAHPKPPDRPCAWRDAQAAPPGSGGGHGAHGGGMMATPGGVDGGGGAAGSENSKAPYDPLMENGRLKVCTSLHALNKAAPTLARSVSDRPSQLQIEAQGSPRPRPSSADRAAGKANWPGQMLGPCLWHL